MDGQQQVHYDPQNFGQLPIEKVMQPDGRQLVIHVPYADSFTVHANVWKANVGRVSLYLLDTDNELNSNTEIKEMKDNSVSIAKGIAIILMVLAHTRFSEYGNYWINMFHMPLFFFFAGYCFKDKYLEIPSDFVIKRFKGLYKPFVKWGLIFLVLHNLFFYLNIYNDEFGFRGIVQHLYTWQEMLKKAVSIVTRMSDTEQLLGGYWFLKSLFWGPKSSTPKTFNTTREV